MSNLGAESRADYYREYWRAADQETSEYLRWKIEVTRNHPVALSARSVLDVGCGTGAVLKTLVRPDRRVCGVEMAAEAVAALVESGIEAYRVDLDNDALPFRDGEFELVVCYDVLEHVFAPGRLLAEIDRVLAPGGSAFLCVPNTLNLFNRLVFLGGDFVDIMDTSHRSNDLFSNHIRLFSKKLFERFLEGNGFRVRDRHFYFPERFTDSRFRLPAWTTRFVTLPGLHVRAPSAFALGFLYACDRAGGGTRAT